MMNPWDRERTWRETQPNSQPRGFASGLAWLVAVVLGILGMVAMAKGHGDGRGHSIAMIPIGISLFFIFMFMIGHRREQRRLANMRMMQPPAEPQLHTPQGMTGQPVVDLLHQAPPTTLETQKLPKADDASLRKLYDRFDVRAIEQCRASQMDARQITSFLEMARDFVDTGHAAQLIRRNDLAELDTHMHAALERAKIQHELDHPGAFKATPRPALDEPPF